MRLPNDPNKFTSQFKYIEVGRLFFNEKTQKPGFTREKINGQPNLITVEEAYDYAKKHDDTAIYSSVLQYNSQHFDQAASLGPLYFDLDSDDLEISRSEAIRLVDYLLSYIPESALRVYFSGGKGFHVECEPIALGISTTDDLIGIFRFIARTITDELALTTVDFNVYDLRRMWRLPHTRHQRSGLFKVECLPVLRGSSSIDAVLDYAREPRYIDIPEQAFDYKANQWYREFTYKMEQLKIVKQSPWDLMARFLEEGTGHIKSFKDVEKVFDKFTLLKKCPAVRDLEQKANTAHHLEHYERLFLCSILTYSPDAVRFLHEILSQCSDYHYELSNAHVEDWIKRREYGIGGRPFTCEKAKQVGIMCNGCTDMEPRRKVVQLESGKYIETGELSSPSPVRFAYRTIKE
jgi:hypothetical protein